MPRATVLTVGEYLDGLNAFFAESSAVVMGEVAELRTGGAWVSFSLKDERTKAVLKCVCASWKYQRLGVALEDGMVVKVGGTPRITVHYGSFGFWVDTLEPIGEGSLKRAYDALKKKLGAEGLFARKRPLPEFIEHIGIVTSKSGVVMKDFLKNLKPLDLKIVMYDSPVEGIGAVDSLSWAMRYWQGRGDKIDVLVIIRGGGGLESMQAFNNESVCREIFAVPVPVVAGIGHEVDVPLASLVADCSVSTPTAAAHVVNQSWERARVAVDRYDPARAFERALDMWRNRVQNVERLLKFADPARNLRLGYAIVRNEKGVVVKDAKSLRIGSRVATSLARGNFISNVEKTEN